FLFTCPLASDIYTFPYTTLFRSALRSHPRRWPRSFRFVADRGACAFRRGQIRPFAECGSPSRGCSWCMVTDLVGAHLLEKAESQDRKSTRLNSSHVKISYAVFCL